MQEARGYKNSSCLQILSLSGKTGASGPNARPLVDPAVSLGPDGALSRFLVGTRRAQETQQRPKRVNWRIVQVFPLITVGAHQMVTDEIREGSK